MDRQTAEEMREEDHTQTRSHFLQNFLTLHVFEEIFNPKLGWTATCRSDSPNMNRSNIDEREEMLRQKESELKSREAEETTRQMTFGKVSSGSACIHRTIS